LFSLKKELIMKKILLGTTGLVAVAMLATAANAAETPKVTLGGFSDFQSGWTNDDRDGAKRTNGFRNDNEVTVKVDGKTAGGLGYGAEIDLEADVAGAANGSDADNQGVNASRTFTYLEGGFGRVELGSNKSVAATMRVDASSLAAATGGINGAWTYFVNAPAVTTNFISTSKLVSEHGRVNQTNAGDEQTYNATKVSYYTPKFSGFQAGVSYTPQLDDRGQTMTRSDVASVNDIIDLGLGYEGVIGGVKLAASGTYETGAGDGVGPAGFGTDDVRAWNVGALLGYQGFEFAGSYGDWADSGIAAVDGDYWTAGLGYTTGPIGASVTYLTSELGNNEFDNIVVGADYKLAAGLTPYAEVSFYDFNAAGAASDNQGTSFILGTQVAF
jgi:outer membrane protein OmpU